MIRSQRCHTRRSDDAEEGCPWRSGETARDPEQADQILRESEDRTEDNSTVDPDDHNVIRRRTEETADPVDEDDDE